MTDFLGHFILMVGRKQLLDAYFSKPPHSSLDDPSFPSQQYPAADDLLSHEFPDIFCLELWQCPGTPVKHRINHYIKTSVYFQVPPPSSWENVRHKEGLPGHGENGHLLEGLQPMGISPACSDKTRQFMVPLL